MQQQRFERLAEMLAAADPPAAVDLLLRLLIECNEAVSGAVLTVVAGRLVLRVVSPASPVSPDLVASACTAWPGCEDRLRSGTALAGNDHVLVPLLHERALVGALYLEIKKLVDPAPLAHFLAALAKAMSNAGWTMKAQPDERTLLRRVLEDTEWNISRAARVIGVTRRTVYLRMKRLGIPRRKRTDGSA